MNPVEIIARLNGYLEELDKAGKGLDEALELLVEAEDQWETAYDIFVTDLVDEYARSNKRLPGEDVRIATCRQQHREAWQTFRRAERAVQKYEKRISRLKAQVSGLQSELSALKAESFAPDHSQQPQWTR